MKVVTSSYAVFACHSKACAPPPAGKGGSDLAKAHAAGEHGGDWSATVHEGCKDCGDRLAKIEADMAARQVKYAADEAKREKRRAAKERRDARKYAYTLSTSDRPKRDGQ